MKRRSLLVGAGAAAGCAALGALAQTGSPPKRLGCLWHHRKTDRNLFVPAFEARLHGLGWIEGRNLVIVRRYADNDPARYEAIAREVAAEKVDVIHAYYPRLARAAHKAAPDTPIVFSMVADPVFDGLVASLARPGGNITGATTREVELFPKRIQLVRELLPKAKHVAYLRDKLSQGMTPLQKVGVKSLTDAGRQLGLEVETFDIASVEDVRLTFRQLARGRFDAVLAFVHARVSGNDRRVFVEEAERARLPAIYVTPDYVERGGLMSFSQNIHELGRRGADYVDKILRGAKPADLPVEEPNVFELVVNRKAAQAIGLAIPQSILVRADRVIE